MKKILIALLLFPFAAQAQTPKIPLITSAQDPSQLIGTINQLTNAVNILNTTSTASLTANQTFTGFNTFNNAKGINISVPGSAAFELTSRLIPSFPVPTLYPTVANQHVAFDLSPNGTPTDQGYGQAWSDICAQDVIATGANPLSCIHMGAGTALNVGSAEYSSGTLLDFNLGTLNGDTAVFTTSIKIVGATSIVQLPLIATDATHTDATVCEDTTTHGLYFGSGTAGICLGTSSARFKHDITPLDVGLNEIMKLEPVAYKLNEDHGDPNKLLYGFTAEQGGKALPALAGVDAEGKPNTFDYLGVVPALVKAVQEQQKEIQQLKSMLASRP